MLFIRVRVKGFTSLVTPLPQLNQQFEMNPAEEEEERLIFSFIFDSENAFKTVF